MSLKLSIRQVPLIIVIVASLYADLKRYQDIICRNCRENLSGTTVSPPISDGFTQPSANVISASSTEPLPGEPYGTSGIHGAPEASLSITGQDDDSQGTTEAHLLKTTATVSSPDSASQPASLSSPTESEPDSDWSVEYNPEIRQTLSLYVVDTFAFKVAVRCTKFSRDGKYLAIGLRNAETRIYDLRTESKRSAFVYVASFPD
jgi:glucose repression regulatory protein TUP1